MPIDRSQLERLEKDALIELLLQAFAHMQKLEEEITKLREEVQHLRGQLAKDSHNSSKPPSSDGLKKKPRTQSLREKGKRKPGGVKGHQGDTLKMVSEPDHVIVHDVESCPHCHKDMREAAIRGYERRQVYDIPPLRLEVTEHQATIKHCSGCGKEVRGSFPEHVKGPVQYGPRFKAQASYLNTYHFIPLERTGELLYDFYGQWPSDGMILQANKELETKIESSLEAIKGQITQASVGHFDESGVRAQGKLHWLHVASTKLLTYYGVHTRRGQEGMKEIGILPAFQGRAVHDHWRSYQVFDQCEHAFCNVHHLRELRFVTESYEQAWASAMAELLLEIKKVVTAAKQAGQQQLFPDQQAAFEQRYEAIIHQGLQANPPPTPPLGKKRGRRKQSPPKNLLDRLQTYKPQVLAFMTDFKVPFDNNLAERDVRMIKVKQKVSGAFRTFSGAQTFCAIRSYISTARKQQRTIMDVITEAFLGQPFIPSGAEAHSLP